MDPHTGAMRGNGIDNNGETTKSKYHNGEHIFTCWLSTRSRVLLVRNKRLLVVAAAIIIAIIVVLIVVLPRNTGSPLRTSTVEGGSISSSCTTTSDSLGKCLPGPVLAELNTAEGRHMVEMIHTVLPNRSFYDPSSTQVKALKWLLNHTFFLVDEETQLHNNISIDERKLRRYALAAVWMAGHSHSDELGKDSCRRNCNHSSIWDDPDRGTWLDPIDECDWTSRNVVVDCVDPTLSTNFRHFYLIFPVYESRFLGTLPPELGLLTGMEFFQYHREYEEFGITGTLPSEIGLLTNMRILEYSGNHLFDDEKNLKVRYRLR